MLAVIEQLNAWSQRGIDLLWPIVWQSTLVAIVVGLIAMLLRKYPPRLRYWLWQIVAVKLLLMPFWTVAVSLPEWSSPASADRSEFSTPLPHDSAALPETSIPGEAAQSRTRPQVTPVSSPPPAPTEASAMPLV